MTTSFAGPGRFTVLRNGMYRLLFVATLGSGLGTWMATIALTADVDAKTNSTWWVSALFLVTFLPSVVVGLAIGPLIDRLSRKLLIVASDLVRLLVFAALPFAHRPLTMLLLAAVAGVANSFFRPAVLAGVPNLLDDEELDSGTALLQGTDWLGAAAGPVVGGALVSVSGPHVVYFINAATFLFSALLLIRIPGRLLQSEQGITRGHWRDLGDGLQAFRRIPALRVALVAFGFTMLSAGLLYVSEIFLATRAFDSGAFGYGLLWSGSGIGLVVGSVLTGPLLEERDVLDIYPLAFVPCATGLLGAALAPNVWVGATAMVLTGLGQGLAFPMTVLIVQRHAPDSVRGRAFTVIISIHNALLGLAMVASGALTDGVGPRWTYGLAAVCTGLSALTALVLARGTAPKPAFAHH
ncbi:MAG TPA: MFS transporter [Gaiellaceae bacterium]|nr:MFS transporter [Gaiellaceae bacterium]